jgi:hypothetical protein
MFVSVRKRRQNAPHFADQTSILALNAAVEDTCFARSGW